MTLTANLTPDALHAERVARVALSANWSPTAALARTVATEGVLGALSADPFDTERDTEKCLRGAERVLDQADAAGIRYIIPTDDEWPAQLAALAGVEIQSVGGTPLGLWAVGPLRLNELACPVAVVGARAATTYGADVAANIAGGLARAGSAVVSGAAYGIDVAAHRAALAADGHTVAVLACGVDRDYPAGNREPLETIRARGLVVSEYPPGSSPTRTQFLARNRVIAGLSRGTVIVEAASRSGSLNSANWTTRMGRPLMAVPGPVTSATSQGCHALLRTGTAALTASAADVLETLHRN